MDASDTRNRGFKLEPHLASYLALNSHYNGQIIKGEITLQLRFYRGGIAETPLLLI